MKYTHFNAPENIPIYGCMFWYKYNNNFDCIQIRMKPRMGIIINGKFYTVSRNVELFYVNDKFNDGMRYADTYEECVELYNKDIEIKGLELN